MTGYKVFDAETGTKTQFKRKASPFYGANKVHAVGWKGSGEARNQFVYFKEGIGDGWLAPLLTGKFLITFNGKFDILHAMCAGPLNRRAWIEFIDRGGIMWDGQQAEYLLHGMAQEVQMCSMDDTAPKYGGNLKNDAVKALWEAGIDTPEIDQDLLLEYLVGFESYYGKPHPHGEKDYGDIGNTELIFLGQLAAFRARGGLKSAILNMHAVAFTIEAEFNGMYVDKPGALIQAEQIKLELDAASAELNEFIPKDLPFEFNWGSRFHKSGLIFGGDVKYKARGFTGEYGTKEVLEYKLVSGESTTEAPTSANIMQYESYKGGAKQGELKTKKTKVIDKDNPKSKIMDFVYKFPGYTEPEPSWSSSTPGVYSTKAEILEELQYRDVPFTIAFSKRAKLDKDLGTYYIKTNEDGEQTGMLTLVGPDGIVHHRLNTNSTVTGRLSSSEPNLQNISKGEYDEETGEEKGSQIKRYFVSRFDGGHIVQSDFTSLEIYVQATLTGCKQLIADLKAGLDMHILRAATAWGASEGLDYDAIRAILKDEHHPVYKVWKKKRNNAKVFSFQRAFGAGVPKIAKFTKLPEEEVQALVVVEEERYPELGEYVANVTQHIQASRVPTGKVFDHPEVRGITCFIGKGFYTTPDGKLYSYMEYPSKKWQAERKGIAQSFMPTEIKNYVVQGTGGEWAKAAMYLALRATYRYWLEHPESYEKFLLVNQVHDAVYKDAHPDWTDVAAALLHAAMLEASAFMDYHFTWDIPIPVPSETKVGRNMMEERDMSDTACGLVPTYRKWIRDTFINSHTPYYERNQ